MEKVEEGGPVPKCELCQDLMTPDLVLGGGKPKLKFPKARKNDQQKADLLLVVGTSLTVLPVSDVPKLVNPTCHKVLVTEEVEQDWLDYFQSNDPDINAPGTLHGVCRGNADDLLQVLVDLCRWREQLKKLMPQSDPMPSSE